MAVQITLNVITRKMQYSKNNYLRIIYHSSLYKNRYLYHQFKSTNYNDLIKPFHVLFSQMSPLRRWKAFCPNYKIVSILKLNLIWTSWM